MSIFHRVPRYSIGIDFGTTTSRLSYVDNSADINVFPTINPLRSLATPIPRSYGNIKYDWQVGEHVIDSMWAHYSLFKLHMGVMQPIELNPKRRPDEKIEVRPEILAAKVMWELYQIAIDTKRELARYRDVVITVPAEWNAVQRQATIMAGRIAGFSNIYLIEEPIAAYLAIAAYYPNDQLQKAENLLVFDYGGGTLDITIIHRPERGLPYVIGRSMNQGELGGEALDERLCRKIFGDLRWSMMSKRDQRYLANKVRQMKESLNPEPGKTVMLNATWPEDISLLDSPETIIKEEMTLSSQVIKGTLEESITHKLEEHILAAIRATHSPRLDVKDIDAVILVGGSSYLREVQEIIKRLFLGKDFGSGIYLEQPEKLVAFGAALYKSYIDRRKQKFQLHVPMHTYMVITNNEDERIKLPLDNYKGGQLPIIPKPPKICPVPKKATNIHWEVFQEHTYAKNSPSCDVVEEVNFSKPYGRSDHLRIDYEIDRNGCISKWRPVLTYRQKTVVVSGITRQYDWQNEDPTTLSKEYGIRKASS